MKYSPHTGRVQSDYTQQTWKLKPGINVHIWIKKTQEIFTALKVKTSLPVVLHLENVVFGSDRGGEKHFPIEENLKEHVNTRPVLQELV
jgi:hypothetical protein